MSFSFFVPGEGAGETQGFLDVEAEGVRSAGVEAGRVAVAAGAGVDPAFRAVRGRGGGGDVGAGTGARVEQAHCREAIEGVAVILQVLGLEANRCFPLKAEPAQIFLDGGGVIGAAAGRVDVLDAEEEAAAGLAGAPPGDEGRVGAA